VANQSPVSGGVSPDPIQERQIRSQIFGLLASFAADLSSLGPVAATERHALAGVGTRLGAEIAGLLGPYESLRASASGVDIAMLAGPEASVRFRQELAVIAKNGDEQIRVLRHDWKVVPQGHGWKIAEGTVVTE
jgi:hypothetical protein